MNGLLLVECDESSDALGCGGEGRAHTFARGAADYIVAVEGGGEGDGGEKVGVEFGAKTAQFREGEIVQLDALFEGKAHGVADLLMRGAEGNALVNQIRSRSHGIQVAGVRGIVHALAIEL